jgi:hypothetical protein
MATNLLDFGSLFGADDSGLSEYLTPAQKSAMNTQALMQAASALLQASGPSTQRISFGQALGSAMQAGSKGYSDAQQNMINQVLMKQKLDESRRTQAADESYRNFMLGIPVEGAPVTPQQAISAPVTAEMPAGPTVERAEMIGQKMPAGTAPNGMSVITPTQRALISALPREKGIPEMLKLLQPPKTTGSAFKGADGKYYIQTEGGGVIPAPIAPADLGAEEFGTPTPMVGNGRPVMVQYNKKGESRIATGVAPYEPQSQDIRAVEYITGQPLAGQGAAGISSVGQYRQQIAPKTSVTVPVDMTGGQKGFENEMSLGKAFKAEPIYKDFNDMKTAYSQVITALDQGTPIGDVAGATKVMKLLDPGSVVRETELAIAMQASGRLDRLQNYFSLWASGQKLTPTQRDDFKQLSAELYAAAGQAYTQKRGEYKDFGSSYGFKNLDTALGPVPTLPSLVRKTKPSAATTTPPAIQDLLNKYPPRTP